MTKPNDIMPWDFYTPRPNRIPSKGKRKIINPAIAFSLNQLIIAITKNGNMNLT